METTLFIVQNTDFDYGNVYGNNIVQSFITYNPLQKSLMVWKIDADTLMSVVNIDDIELFTRSAQGDSIVSRKLCSFWIV